VVENGELKMDFFSFNSILPEKCFPFCCFGGCARPKLLKKKSLTYENNQ